MARRTAGSHAAALAELKRLSTRKDWDNLKRFGIVTAKAIGVSMARWIGRDTFNHVTPRPAA